MTLFRGIPDEAVRLALGSVSASVKMLAKEFAEQREAFAQEKIGAITHEMYKLASACNGFPGYFALPREAFTSSYVYVLFSGDKVSYVGRTGQFGLRLTTHARSEIEFDRLLLFPLPDSMDREIELILISAIRPPFNFEGKNYRPTDDQLSMVQGILNAIERFAKGEDPAPDVYRCNDFAKKAAKRNGKFDSVKESL